MTKRPSVMSLDDLMGAKPEAPPAPTQVPEPSSTPTPAAELPVVVEPTEPESTEAKMPPKAGRKPVPEVFRTSLYFHRTVHDALREIAYDERLTISDLINEGIDLVLKGRGYPLAAELKTKSTRKRKR